MAKTDSAGSFKVISENRKARFNYHILEVFEAGMVLTGAEVKSARNGGARLNGAYVMFRREEAFLVGAHVGAYKPAANLEYDPGRARKLLLTKRELSTLRGVLEQDGMNLVPLELVAQGNYLKLVLAIGKGKKLFEKKQAKKERDIMREASRSIKQRLRHR